VIPGYTRRRYQKEAYSTWKRFFKPNSTEDQLVAYMNGTLSCFCDDEYSLHGMRAAFKSYRKDGMDQVSGEARLQLGWVI